MRLSVRTCSADTYEVCHVATKMPTTQVSVMVNQFGSYPASYAVDGSRRTSMWDFTCAHSGHETNPWLTVDLRIPLTITGVFFTNRGAPTTGMCKYV